ncbi:NB-ARC domain-containing protein [Nocardia takedensis]
MTDMSASTHEPSNFHAEQRVVQGLVQGDGNVVQISYGGPSARGPVNLAPPRLDRIFGRDEVVRQLLGAIEAARKAADPAPIVLCGRPGVGKTAVAQELAFHPDVLTLHPDGVLWISLGKDGQGILPGLLEWARVLEISPSDIPVNSVASWCRALHYAMQDRSFLVIIDDVWRVDDALPFLIGGDRCSRFITSRSQAVTADLSPNTPYELDDLESEYAQQLLAHAAGFTTSPLAAKLPAVLEISGTLPLALVVAGAYLRRSARGGDPDRIGQAFVNIRDRRLRLDLARPGSPFEHRDVPTSLAAMISLSVDELGDGARKALRILAHLPPKPNSFSKTAATAICGVSDSAVYELVDSGLLDVVAATHRYALHQSVVDFALELPQEKGAQRSIVTHFIAEAERCKEDWNTMQADFSNTLMALDLAFEQGHDNDYVRGVLALAPMMKGRVPYVDGERYLRRALRLVRKGGNEGAEARLLVHLAEMAQVTEGSLSAQAYAQEGLRVSATQDRIRERIDLLLQLGTAQHASGDLESAMVSSRDAHRLATEIGDRERIARAAFRMGGVTHEAGDEDTALQHCRTALTIARELSLSSLQADVSYVLGWVHYVRGEYHHALTTFETGCELGRRAGSRRTVAIASDGIGWLRFVLGDLAGSLEAYREGLQNAEEIDDVHAAALLSNLGVVQQATGDVDGAEQAYNRAIALSERFQQEQFCCKAWFHYGELECGRGQYELALKYLATAADLATRSGFTDLAIQISRARTEVFIEWGNLAAARGELETSAESRQNYTNTFEIVRLTRVQAALETRLGNAADSRTMLLEVLVIAEAQKFRAEAALCRLALARVEMAVEDGLIIEVRRYAQHALDELGACGHFARLEAEQLLESLS